MCSKCNKEYDSIKEKEADTVECHNCGEELCTTCSCTCSGCGKVFCSSCLERCSRCRDFYCSSCLSECSKCGERGCENCFGSCSNCGTSVCTRCLTICYDCDNSFCDDCIGTCSDCDRNICHSCLVECNDCGRYFCNRCTNSCESCDVTLCRRCGNTCEECGNTYCSNHSCDCNEAIDLTAYSREPYLMDFDAKADWQFVKQPWENTTFLGLELEMSFPEELFHKFSSITKNVLKGLHIWKKEGLINDTEESIGSGGELVVTPHTYISHRKLPWKQMLKDFQDAGAISYDAKSCALHIHTNLSNLTRRDINKLKTFFVYNTKFITTFAKKTRHFMNEYSYIPEIDELDNWLEDSDKFDRYVCLNETKETLEFRIFRGTLQYDRFKACLQFVESIIDFVKNHSIASCRSDQAVNYFKEHNKKRFPLLNKYIETLNY